METTTFTINEFAGSDAQVLVTLTDIFGGVQVRLEVVSGYLADLVGFFADFNSSFAVNEDMIIELVSETPGDLTTTSETSNGAGILFLDDSGSTTDGITDVDSNVNLNGQGIQRIFDLGVQFGGGGLGGGADDFRSVTFNLKASELDISDFEEVGVRLQSVGANRDGSSKLEGVPGDTPTPAISIVKLTNGDDGLTILEGSNVTWTYAVTNTGNVNLSTLNVTDNQLGVVPVYDTGDNGNGIFEAGEIWLYKASGTAIEGDYENTGTATSTYIGQPVTASDESSYFGAAPSIAINKLTNEVDGETFLVGGSIIWTYAVTNTGNVSLFNLAVTDNKGVVPVYDTGDNGNGIFEAGEIWLYKASGTAIAGAYSNIGSATASFTDDLFNTATPTATDPSSYFGAAPSIAINKLTNGVDGGTFLEGSSITWTYEITNTGNVALSNISVSDDKLGSITSFGGDDNSNGLLDLTEKWTYTKTGTASVGNYSNIGSATGSFTDDLGNTATPTATDPSSYFGADPKIAIDKVTTIGSQTGDGLQNVTLGSAVTWTYTVTNTGNVELSKVTVTDNQGVIPVLNGNLSTGEEDGILNLNDTWVYTATGTAAVVGNYSNIGTASGSYTDSAGHTGTATASDGSSYSTERGLGKTPGFWKQTQHFQYWPSPYQPIDKTPSTSASSFTGTFGLSGMTDVNGNFKYGNTIWFKDTLLGALSAEDLKGTTGSNAVKNNGNVSALGRAATAGLLNATADKLDTDVKGSYINYIIDPRYLSSTVVTFLRQSVDIGDIGAGGLGAGDQRISSEEVIQSVQKAFGNGFNGLSGAAAINTLATAFDAMNNMAGG